MTCHPDGRWKKDPCWGWDPSLVGNAPEKRLGGCHNTELLGLTNCPAIPPTPSAQLSWPCGPVSPASLLLALKPGRAAIRMLPVGNCTEPPTLFPQRCLHRLGAFGARVIGQLTRMRKASLAASGALSLQQATAVRNPARSPEALGRGCGVSSYALLGAPQV